MGREKMIYSERMNRVTFSRLWIAPAAMAKITRLDRAAWREGYDAPWPPAPETEIDIEPSRWADGALWIWWRGSRYQIEAGDWRLDQ